MINTLEITGTSILSAVIKSVHDKYPDIPIYKELVNQGIRRPRITILCEDFNERKLMRENYLQTFIISVLYEYKEMPESSYFQSNHEAYKLMNCLRKITLQDGNKLRGTDINWYTDKGTVEVYVNYTIKVASESELEPKPKMLTQTVNIYKKEKGE